MAEATKNRRKSPSMEGMEHKVEELPPNHGVDVLPYIADIDPCAICGPDNWLVCPLYPTLLMDACQRCSRLERR